MVNLWFAKHSVCERKIVIQFCKNNTENTTIQFFGYWRRTLTVKMISKLMRNYLQTKMYDPLFLSHTGQYNREPCVVCDLNVFVFFCY